MTEPWSRPPDFFTEGSSAWGSAATWVNGDRSITVTVHADAIDVLCLEYGTSDRWLVVVDGRSPEPGEFDRQWHWLEHEHDNDGDH